MDKENVPTNEEIEKAFENTNFGAAPNNHTLKFAVLKVASGYHNGYTAQCILFELGLVDTDTKKPILTRRGEHCLWEWFQGGYKHY